MFTEVIFILGCHVIDYVFTRPVPIRAAAVRAQYFVQRVYTY